MLFRQADDASPVRQIDSSLGAADRIDTGTEPEWDSTIIGACVGDCALCGDYNRVAIVSSGGVVSHCLRCQDETMLTTAPAWCHMARLRQAARTAGGLAQSVDASANAGDGGGKSTP